ncbi:hypothetical protein TgHK011_009591 [Trichoderma gracile]|nr:hypothetical protein TgHK011_009591 [Trichoderma gracile]
MQNNEQILIRRQVGQSQGHNLGSSSRAIDGPSRRSGRYRADQRYGLVLREERETKNREGKRSKGKGTSQSKSSRHKQQQKSHRSQHSRRHSSYDSGSGDEGLDEDTQNQIGFWLDETAGGNEGDYQGGSSSRGKEVAGGHDNVSSLHEEA